MIKVECVTVKLFPVLLKDKVLHLFIERRTRIRRQNFKVSSRRIKFTSKAYGCFDAVFCVLQESEDIEGGRANTKLPTQGDHVAQPRGVHRTNQLLVEIVHARFAFKRETEAASSYAFGNKKTAFPLERKKRVSNNDVRLLVHAAQFCKLRQHVFRRARSKTARD